MRCYAPLHKTDGLTARRACSRACWPSNEPAPMRFSLTSQSKRLNLFADRAEISSLILDPVAGWSSEPLLLLIRSAGIQLLQLVAPRNEHHSGEDSPG